MTTQFDFDVPLDKPYDPLNSVCMGVTIFNKLVKWNLDVKTGVIKLSNDVGLELNLGRLTKVAVRCSLALPYTKIPHFIIEFNDGSKTLFKYNIISAELKSIPVNLDKLRDISILYNKTLCRTGLVINGIGKDGIYRGTLIDDILVIKNINPLSDTSKISIHRFGLDTKNRLVTEITETIT